MVTHERTAAFEPPVLTDEVLQQPAAHEARKSFDVLASVRMFRSDLYWHGRVLPETRTQVQNEELSLIAEGTNRAARTEFALQRQEDGGLAYFFNGTWRPYRSMLETGLEVAESEAAVDPRKQFLAEDAARDLFYGDLMASLNPGQHVAWASPYRRDIEAAYGPEFMRSCGRFPERQMAFLYRAYCEDNGNVVLHSQTVDRSDPDAIAAALQTMQHDPYADMDTMVDAYDDVLSAKEGKRMYAGRDDAEARENVWQTILAQQDLVQYFTTKLEAIADSPVMGVELEDAVKRHVYGTWAAFKKRVDGETAPAYQPVADGGYPIVQQAMLENEVTTAFNEFALAGRAMVGCGGKIEILQGIDDILRAKSSDVYDAMFGKKKEEADRFGPLVFKCKKGHTNRRPRNTLIDRCHVKGCAKGSVGC